MTKFTTLALIYFCLLTPTIFFSQDGTLDNTFSSDGLVETDILAGIDDEIQSTAIQADGKIVVVGFSTDAGTSAKNISIVRYNSDGTLDNTFDTDGIVTTVLALGNSYAYGVAIQSDGRIVVSGRVDIGTSRDAVILRYNSDGSLDNTFDSDGIFTYDFSNLDIAFSVALQSDEKIVFSLYDGSTFSAVRLNSDGTLDNNFSTDGMVNTVLVSGKPAVVYSIAVQPDGKIVLAGFTYFGVSFDQKIALVRYNTDGSLDNTFDSDGILMTVVPGNSESSSFDLAIKDDGKIVVGGTAHNGSNFDYLVVRYSSNGSLDNTFGGNGIVTFDIGEFENFGTSIVLQNDGKILLAGMSKFSISQYDIIKFNYDGTLDNTFDGDGIVNSTISSSFSSGISPFSIKNSVMALQDDGKIVLGGFSNIGVSDEFAVARYNNQACSVPKTPTAINGFTSVCAGTSITYTLTELSGAEITDYTWTIPSGWTGTSTTNTLTVTPNGAGGNITVVANNSCGSSAARTISVSFFTSIPTIPSTITGQTAICSGSSNTYSVTIDANASSYDWTLPNAWTGTSTTSSITSTANATSGNITVSAYNACGSSALRTLAINVSPSIPASPATITGLSAVCVSTTNTYSIAAVNNATSYTWTLPNAWTGNSTTATISATASGTGGNITVKANNACGSSPVQTLAVSSNSNIPAIPISITGQTNVCSGSSNTYSIAAVNGALSYTWALPSGWSGSSNSTTITSTANSTSGNITVTSNNGCGSSATQTLAVIVTTIPVTPSSIIGQNIICPTSTNIYQIASVNGATSYTWTLPSGWTGTSTTNSISATANNNGGNVTVKANNICGSSSAKTLAVTLDQAPTLTASVSSQISCFGLNDGAINYATTGTIGNYLFTWNDGSTNTNLSSLGAGVYTITGNNGICTISSSVTLFDPQEIIISPVVTKVSTCGGVDGSILVNASGGTSSSYLYTWTGTATGSSGTGFGNSFTINNLLAGNYNITVTNGGCQNNKLSSVGENGAPTLTISEPKAISCPGDADGSLKVTSSGSLTGYSFTWSNLASGIQINNLSAGNYSVVGTNGTCKATGAYELLNPIQMSISGATGLSSIDINVIGGTGSLSYSWTGPNGFTSTSQNLSQLTATGNYIVTVTDSKGCSEDQTFVLSFVGNEEIFVSVNEFKIYPNPVSELITFEVTNEIKKIVLTDFTGKILDQINIIEKEKINFNVSHLSDGMYFYNFFDSNGHKIYSDKFSVVN